MSAPLNEEMLHRYMDGDLDAEGARSVEAQLEQNAEYRTMVERLRATQKLMRQESTTWAASVDSDALFARIQEDVKKRANAKSAQVIPFPKPVRWAMAIAAAVAIAFYARRTEHTPPAQVTNISKVAKVAQPSPAPMGTEVVRVDFGGRAGSVFSVPGEVGSVAVVWIEDEI